MKKEISAAEYSFFLKGGAVIGREVQMDNPCRSEFIVQGGVCCKMALLVFYVHSVDTKYMNREALPSRCSIEVFNNSSECILTQLAAQCWTGWKYYYIQD
jgi:hypothetical protein